MAPPTTQTADPIAPHPVLPGYYDRAEDRQRTVDQMFDQTAEHYDRVCAIMSFGSGAWYRERVLRQAGLQPGHRVVDLACGTGQVGEAATRIVGDTGEVIGVDPSEGMRRVAETRRGLRTVDGKAAAIPVEDNWADLVVMGYALRHAGDLGASFKEMARVLRPGGRLLILEITAPDSKAHRAFLKAYMNIAVPTLSFAATGSKDMRTLMKYYWETIESCVRPAVILDAMRTAGFIDVEVKTTFGMLNDYSATRPIG